MFTTRMSLTLSVPLAQRYRIRNSPFCSESSGGEVSDAVLSWGLASRALTPSHVRNNPLIYQGCAVTRKKALPAGPRDSTASGTSPPEDPEQ